MVPLALALELAFSWTWLSWAPAFADFLRRTIIAVRGIADLASGCGSRNFMSDRFLRHSVVPESGLIAAKARSVLRGSEVSLLRRGSMPQPQPAVHRTILVVDVEGFGDHRRANPHQVAVRKGLYTALRRAFRSTGIRWADCHREDRGDGVFVLAPPEVPKALFVEALPHELVRALSEHNGVHRIEERIRLRMALHAGEIIYDHHGVTAVAINAAFRLLDARPLKDALANSSGILALIVSSWFFDEVVRHSMDTDPATYRPVRVAVKETSTVAWIALPDYPYPHDETSLEIPSAGPDRAVPRQLPAHTQHFVGRADELAELTGLLDRAVGWSQPEGTPGTAGTVVISAIGGTAGIGKTALALRWAHQVAGRFPDGQLYVNLRGFDPAGSPVRPAEAIHGFLDALGVEPARIPVELDAQAALYRS